MLVGSGGSIEGLLFADWTKEFNRDNSVIHVTYVTTKSSDGLNAIISHTGDFGAGEIPLSAEKSSQKHAQLAEIPIAVISVVPVYNLPVNASLRFTGDVLAQIYMGNISRWNDSRIAALNPGVFLPNLPIIVISRPEGSGTRYIFTEFLCKNSPKFCQWNQNPHPRIPAELEIAGSEALAGKVAGTTGAIGYVNTALVSRYKLTEACVRNSVGSFVKASRNTISSAYAANRDQISQDLTAPLIDAAGDQSYPMVGFAWVYVLTEGTPKRTQALHEFLSWCLHDGQRLIGQDFLPLPESVAVKANARLDVALGQSQ